VVSDYSVAAQQLGAPSGFAGASSGRAPAVYGRPSPYTNVPTGFIPPLPRQQPQPEEAGGFGFNTFFEGDQLLRTLGFGRALEDLRGIPGVGRPAAAIASEFAAPVNIALAAAGAPGALRAIRPAVGATGILSKGRRILAGDPRRSLRESTGILGSIIPEGTFAQRLAGESVIGLGARTAAEELDLPGPLRFAEPVLGGAAGLVLLRKGQKRFPGLVGRNRVDANDVSIEDHITKFSDLDNIGVDDPRRALTLGGAQTRDQFNRISSRILSNVPGLRNIMGNSFLNPGVADVYFPAKAAADSANSVLTNKMAEVIADTSRPGRLLDTESAARGYVRLGDLSYNKNLFEGESGYLDEIAFSKNKDLNDDASRIRDVLKSVENYDEAHEISYRALANESKEAPRLTKEILTTALERQRANMPEVPSNSLDDLLVPLGEVMERHADEGIRGYFPRIANFSKDDDLTAQVTSMFRQKRATGDEPFAYQTMFELGEQLDKTANEMYWLDPEVILQARVLGSARAGMINDISKGFDDIGVTGREYMQNNAQWDELTRETAASKLEYRKALKARKDSEIQLRAVRKIKTIADNFERYLSQAKPRGAKSSLEADEIDNATWRTVYEEMRTARSRAQELGETTATIQQVRNQLKALRTLGKQQFGIGTGSPRKSLPAWYKRLEKEAASIERELDKLTNDNMALERTSEELTQSLVRWTQDPAKYMNYKAMDSIAGVPEENMWMISYEDAVREGIIDADDVARLRETQSDLPWFRREGGRAPLDGILLPYDRIQGARLENVRSLIEGNEKLIADYTRRAGEINSTKTDILSRIDDMDDALLDAPRTARDDARNALTEQMTIVRDQAKAMNTNAQQQAFDRMLGTFKTRVSGRVSATEKILRDEVSDLSRIDAARQAYNTARAKQANALRTSQSDLLSMDRGTLAQDIIQKFPMLRGKTFTPEQLRSIESLVRADFVPTELQRKVIKANSFLRSLIATFDLSWLGIQGWAVMASKPEVFMIAASTMLRALKDPAVYADYMKSNRPWVRQALSDGLIINDDYWRDEIVGGAPSREIIKKVTKNIRGVKEGGEIATKIMEKSDQAFTTAGNVARLELYKAFRGVNTDLASLKLSETSTSTGKQLAEAANQLTGASKAYVFDPLKYSVFAPRYTIAMFKNIFDAAGLSENTLKSQLVREAMLKAIMAAGISTFFINEFITGEKTDFRPTVNGRVNSNFMVVKGLAGRDFSLFGPYRSNIRYLTDAFSGNPLTSTKNFARGKGSPLASTVADIIEGRDLGGRPININSLEGFTDTALGYGLSKVTPIALSDVIRTAQEGGLEEIISPVTLAEIAGVTAMDRTSMDLKDSLAQRRFNKGYRELTGKERDQLREEDPEMFQLAQKELQRRAKYDPKSQGILRAQEIDQERISKESQLVMAFESGQIDAKAFRDAMSQLSSEASALKSEVRGATGEETNDSVLSQYYATMEAAEMAPNIIDWNLQEKLENDLRARLTPEEIRIIDERSGQEHAPEAAWYFENKKVIQNSGYFGTLDTAFNQLSAGRFSNLGISSYNELAIALRRAEKQGNITAVRRLKEISKQVERLSDSMRRTMRKQNPKLDTALLQNGYVSKPIS
jgi:hypothetical protein